MKRPLLNARRVLFVIVGLAMIASQLPAGAAKSLSGYPRDMVALAMTPFSPIKRVSDRFWGADEPAEPANGDQIHERNYLELLARNEQLQQQLEDARAIIRQLSELRKLPLQGFEFIPADVTASHLQPTIHSLDINRGAREGVSVGLIVADGPHLVGRISRAGARTASVKLITSPGSKLVVKIVPPPTANEARSQLLQVAVGEDGTTFTARGDIGDPVKVGDLVHLADDSWRVEARGLLVGQVTEVGKDPKTPQLRTRIVVQPMHALPRLTRVVVIHPKKPVLPER